MASETLTNWWNEKNNPSTQQTGLIGLATQQPGTLNAGASTYNPTNWNITPEQTVQGQLNNVLGSGSSLMQRAKAQGLETAQQRGLLNSNMAVGAAQGAMIDKALPIAQRDAEITADSYKTNATAQTDASAFGAQAINRANEFNITKEYDKQKSVFDANTQATMKQLENEYSMDVNKLGSYRDIMIGFGKSMDTINRDTNMDQQSKDYSIKQSYDTMKSFLSLISSVGTIPDISDLLVDNS